jgi:flagellar hook-basal body complex protein FliE
MNFQLAAIGHSFKGSMAYYLHDKRPDDTVPHLTTSDRVAWTETRNLMTDDPDRATRIMIATAKSADELKAAAGIKNTGRKATAGPVFAFSLQWRGDEAANMTRDDMRAAADHAIGVLGFQHLQAVLVAHQDTKNPHVHVILNRIDPATGKSEPVRKPAVLNLDKWAHQFEKERGQIVSPNRAKKYDEIQQGKNAHPDPDERKRYIAAKDAARKTAQPSPAAMLRDMGNAQKVAHRQQWDSLSERYKAGKDAIYAKFGTAIAAAPEQHKAATRSAWADHFRDARAQQKEFDTREKGFAGRIRNALDAVTQQKITGEAGDRNRLALTFNNVLSSQARATAFAAKQEATRAEFSKSVRQQLTSKISALKDGQSAALAAQRVAFAAERAALIQKQDSERAKIREAWAQLKGQAVQERGRGDSARSLYLVDAKARREAVQADYHSRRTDHAAKAWNRGQTRIQQQEKPAMKDAFDRNRIQPAPPKPAPVKTVQLSTPSPAPSPAGVTRAPDRRSAEVPAVDRAAAWAKTAQGQKVVQAQGTPAPAVRKDWSKTATPAPTTPAPKKDWGAVASNKPASAPAPIRGQDFDPEM